MKKILTALLVLVLFLAAIGKIWAVESPLAMVTGIYGQLTVIQKNVEKKATMRMPLFRNDRLSTDVNSKATLLLSDGSEVKMGPGTKLTIQQEKNQRGLLVSLGKIFAKMKHQKTNFQVLSPHGAAAIEGTELQMDVAKGRSALTVSDGKVRFSNKKNSVMVEQAKQAAAASLTAPIASPSTVDYQRIMKWSQAIESYITVIEKFMTNFNQALNISNNSTGGSLLQAQKQVDTLNDCLAQLQSMVPDPLFANGHRYLLSAFANYKSVLVFPPSSPQRQSFMTKANQDYAKAQIEFDNYKGQYDSEVQRMMNP